MKKLKQSSNKELADLQTIPGPRKFLKPSSDIYGENDVWATTTECSWETEKKRNITTKLWRKWCLSNNDWTPIEQLRDKGMEKHYYKKLLTASQKKRLTDFSALEIICVIYQGILYVDRCHVSFRMLLKKTLTTLL